MDYQRLKTRFEENEKRDEEERRSNQRKFEELYNSRNKTNEALTELTTTIKMMNCNIDQQLKNLEKKIDTLSEKK